MELFPPDLFLCYFKRHCAMWTGKRNNELIKDKMRTGRIKQTSPKQMHTENNLGKAQRNY